MILLDVLIQKSRKFMFFMHYFILFMQNSFITTLTIPIAAFKFYRLYLNLFFSLQKLVAYFLFFIFEKIYKSS